MAFNTATPEALSRPRVTRGPLPDTERLCQAIRNSREALKCFREERLYAVREYVGGHWSDDGAARDVPVNLLAQYVSIVSKKLISKAPRFLITTTAREHQPAVSAMQSWANRAADEMGLGETMARAVIDATFSIGIVKVALATPADAQSAGWNLRAGAPFAEIVDLDDFVFDTRARDFKSVSFIGHRYRVTLEAAKAFRAFRGRSSIEATTARDYNEDGDERITTIQHGDTGGEEEFLDMVDLWEIYLPKSRQIVTLLSDEAGYPAEDEEPLLVQRWIGPDSGPYHVLPFGYVPGAAMPKAPAQDLVDLHAAVNVLWRKLIEQAKRQKEVLPYRAQASDAVNRLVDTADGEGFLCDNPEDVQPVSFGGPNAGNFTFVEQLRNVFSWMGGNLDAIGGLGPQAKTATQDKMLAETASASVADLQDTVIRFVGQVGKALAWYWWHDPKKVMRTTYEYPKLPDIQIERLVYPRGAVDQAGNPHDLRRDAPWSRLNVRVDPYSLKSKTPAERAAGLTQVMLQVVMPLAPLLQQQGIQVDLGEYLAQMAELMDMPELKKIVNIQEPPAMDGAASHSRGGELGGMPQSTTRNYVRESTSGRTQQGNNLMLQNAMMGVDAGGQQKGQQPLGA